MKITLTLDDDVARLLDEETRTFGASFKEAVNHFLRLGLMADKSPSGKPFVVTPRKPGLPPGRSYDNVEALLETLDGPAHK